MAVIVADRLLVNLTPHHMIDPRRVGDDDRYEDDRADEHDEKCHVAR